ncbi:Metallophosphoesterase [Candidatus Terasakiella magnetica]|uniref:Metallophosphoesterase n=1 Tax=Candidatus Terasakiella magnetica TaxID=1867952 RepID=A0A1C3RLW9_9PROT|nr:metallophosphoesterase family protein [Candidatus Terasakiella magnetica]SCA58149.1 Metallophosphoesterase [Candidatus Terasakiella magnetica]
MKVLAVSDLHLETRTSESKPLEFDAQGADLLILAGDIDEGERGFLWAVRMAERYNLPTVYINGNHEYWGSGLHLKDLLANKAESYRERGIPIWFLERDIAYIPVNEHMVRVLGATLWSDFALNGEDGQDEAMKIAGQHMPDYRHIRTHPWKVWQKLTPKDTLEMCEETIHWMWEEAIHPYEHGPTIFVTHNAPSFQSVHDEHNGHVLSPVFSSNFEELIDFAHVSLWVHGHVHHSVDYVIHDTRVVCNPHGYFGNENTDYDGHKLIEI